MRLKQLIQPYLALLVLPLLLLTNVSYAQSPSSSPNSDCQQTLDETIQHYQEVLSGSPSTQFNMLSVDDGQALEFTKEAYKRNGVDKPPPVDLIVVIHIAPKTKDSQNNLLLFSYQGCLVDQHPVTDTFINDVIDTIHKNGA